jgi:pseudouridine synthase
VDPEADVVHLNGMPVGKPDRHIYVMLNKPEGIVTSCEHRGEPVVTDLVNLPQRLFPVGRLDKDSTGLLLMTNDGRIHHRLSHPSFDHEKEYDVTVQRPLADQDLGGHGKRHAAIRCHDPAGKGARRISGNRFRIVLMEGKEPANPQDGQKGGQSGRPPASNPRG